MILGDLIVYKENIINIKIKLIILSNGGGIVIMNFNILLLGNNKVILGML